jgi:hypothetical protein
LGKKKSADNKNGIDTMIDHFNSISRWVQLEILKEEKLKNRARRLEFFVVLAQVLHDSQIE